MVEDLLRGFVEEDWVQKLDFSTLEKASGHYVARICGSGKATWSGASVGVSTRPGT
jgi:hypothetical protein